MPRNRTAPREEPRPWSERVLPRLSRAMLAGYASHGDLRHLERKDLPSRQRTVRILNDLLTVLFPSLSGDDSLAPESVRRFLDGTVEGVRDRLGQEVRRSLRGAPPTPTTPESELEARARTVAERLVERLPEIQRRLAADIRAAYADDPAARSPEEIVLSYPCVYAIATYRIAHELYRAGVPIIPRIMSEHAHTLTGIDIHPGATIGENFFIDHGTGVVIGETAEIGNNVRIYQGVTVGARSLSHAQVPDLRGKKRHPTIEDDVVIYSGATILGGETVIGRGSVIGGNVWITSSIPPHTTVTVAPPKLRKLNHRRPPPRRGRPPRAAS